MAQQITPEALYTKQDLDELKLDMEVHIGARLSKLAFPPKVKFLCKMKSECPFQYVFTPLSDQHFKFETCQPNHLKECYFDAETKALHKQMMVLVRSKPIIEDFLKERIEEGSLSKLQPKKLLPMIAKDTGQAFDLYGAVQNHESRVKLKKKFDNIVNEVKAKLLNKKKPKKPSEETQTKGQFTSSSPEQNPKVKIENSPGKASKPKERVKIEFTEAAKPMQGVFERSKKIMLSKQKK